MKKTLTDIDGALTAQHVEALNHAADVKSSNDTTWKMGNYVWELKHYNYREML